MMRGLTRTQCLFAVIVLLTACGGPPSEPEAELRAWVESGIENILRYYFLRQQKIALVSNIEEITVYDGTAAEIVLTVGMAGTNDGVLGFSADAYRFALELEKNADEWQLLSARWGALGDELR